MAESGDEEKTEEPTAKRLKESRDKGQIARSQEFTMFVMLLAGVAGLWMFGDNIIDGLAEIMRRGLRVEREYFFDPALAMKMMTGMLTDGIVMLFPMFALFVLVAISAPALIGGFNWSTEAFGFKISKLNPISGLAKIFGYQGLMNLGKAIIKFSIVAAVAMHMLYDLAPKFIGLGAEPLERAMAHGASLALWVFFMLSLSLIVVVLVDVPFQIWKHNNDMKMSKQEIKDESKQSEGNPEVKGRIRSLQREAAMKRMMSDVPEADVIVTNPEHYAVALTYKLDQEGAPKLVAKGGDHIAAQIKEIGKENNIPIVSAPPLARAIFFTTEVGTEIPEGLYHAVAQVLAYVYRLNEIANGAALNAPDANALKDLPIPEELRH